jgi:hypothetical protein
MRLPRLIAVASLLALGTGCGARRPVEDVTPFAEFGRYAFVATMPGGQRLTGTLDVAPDTLVARAASTECKVAATQPSGDYLAYECLVPGTTGVNLLIDRRNPSRKSTWNTLTQVSRRRDVCNEYRTWENGTRTCIRSTPEEYFERVRVQGALVVSR